jgi:hypothetical protein
MCYIRCVAVSGVPRARLSISSLGLEEDTTMAIEIFYLTAQLHRWLNERVARHLAAQAKKLTH